jgi:N-carbamoylputrescine amidase
MKLSICQLPNDLSPNHPAWSDLVAHVEHARPDLAVLNEMPFSTWIAERATFDQAAATASVEAHEAGVRGLLPLSAAFIGSRPVRGAVKLCNEAFLVAGRAYQPVHQKHYFPQEGGFYEETWFAVDRPGFEVVEYNRLRIGVLLCSELMFTEWARHYRRRGAHVIAVPRASGTNMRHWDAAARMAALVSGCYVLSSNRVSSINDNGMRFGGRGFAYSPTGDLLAETSPSVPFACVDIDVAQVAEAQQNYPCNLRDRVEIGRDAPLPDSSDRRPRSQSRRG